MHLEKVVNGLYVWDDAWLCTEESRNSSYPSKGNYLFSRDSNVGHSQAFLSFHVYFLSQWMCWSLAIPRCATEIIRLVASHALNMCFSIHTSDHCPGLIICMGFSGDPWSSPICQEIDPFKDVWSGDDYLGLMIGDRCRDRNPRTILIAGDKRTVECGIPRKGPCPYPRMIYGQELVQCHNMEQNKWRRLTFLHHGVLLSDGHVEKTTLLHKTYGAESEPYQINFCNIVYSWLKPWVPR